jgi:hypothetical protein
MNSDFDLDILNAELDDIVNIDMSDFGFKLNFEEEEIEREDLSDKISLKNVIEIECKDENELEELYNEMIERGFECKIV